MKIIKRSSKDKLGTGYYYYGSYGEIPVGISYTDIEGTNQIVEDNMHYHKESIEFYIVFKGELVIDVEGQEFILNENKMLMVEPKEKHMVKEITKTPLAYIVFATVKNPEDKVNI